MVSTLRLKDLKDHLGLTSWTYSFCNVPEQVSRLITGFDYP